jgi:hypothetical protein
MKNQGQQMGKEMSEALDTLMLPKQKYSITI